MWDIWSSVTFMISTDFLAFLFQTVSIHNGNSQACFDINM